MMKTKFEFKLWDSQNKRFLKGYEEANTSFLGCANSPESDECLSIAFGNKKEPDSYLIICRKTGLKDKNGKEIYEGDIIKARDIIAPVHYRFGSFFINRLPLSSPFIQDLVEVIGNIYTNPELLEDTENDENH